MQHCAIHRNSIRNKSPNTVREKEETPISISLFCFFSHLFEIKHKHQKFHTHTVLLNYIIHSRNVCYCAQPLHSRKVHSSSNNKKS